MPFTFRKRLRFGPLFVNVGKAGVTSWGIKLGPITRNFTRGTTSVDLPGPVNYRTRPRRRGDRRGDAGLSSAQTFTLICAALTLLFAAVTFVRGRATVATVVFVGLAVAVLLLTLVSAWRRGGRGGAR